MRLQPGTDAVVIKFDRDRTDRETLLGKLKKILDDPSDDHAWLFYSLIYNLLLAEVRDSSGNKLFYFEKGVGIEGGGVEDLSFNGWTVSDKLDAVFKLRKVADDDEFLMELKLQLDDILKEAEIDKIRFRGSKEDEVFGMRLHATFLNEFREFGLEKFGKHDLTDNAVISQDPLLPPLYFLAPFEKVDRSTNWDREDIHLGVLEPLILIEEYGYSPPYLDELYGSTIALQMIFACLGRYNKLEMKTRKKAAALLSIMGINRTYRQNLLKDKNKSGDIRIPEDTRKKCFLLSWYSHMFSDDAAALFDTFDEYINTNMEMWLRPVSVDPRYLHDSNLTIPKNLLFFTRTSLTEQMQGFVVTVPGAHQVGFPPLDVTPTSIDYLSRYETTGGVDLNILPEKALEYLLTTTPAGAAVIANAILTTLLRKYHEKSHQQDVFQESNERKDLIMNNFESDPPENDSIDVLHVYNVPAVKALCDTVGFKVDIEKFGARKGKIVPAYFDIPPVLAAFGELLVCFRMLDNSYHQKSLADGKPRPEFGERSNRLGDTESNPTVLPLVSKLLPAALEFKFEENRICWIGYHNGEFLEIPKSGRESTVDRNGHLSSINLANFKIRDYGAPLIGVDIASSSKFDAEVTAELVGLPNASNAGFLVANSIFEEETVCLGISSLPEERPVMSQKSICVERANIVALPNTNQLNNRLKSYPLGAALVVLSCICDLLSLVGAVALLMLGLVYRDNDWTLVAVASVELVAELLTRIVLFWIIKDRPKDRPLHQKIAALSAPIDFTLREDPQEIPAYLWRKPLAIEGLLGLLSAAFVTVKIRNDNNSESSPTIISAAKMSEVLVAVSFANEKDTGAMSSKLFLYLPSILVLLLFIVRGQLVTAFVELFNTCEKSMVPWKEIGPIFLLSYFASLVTEIFLLDIPKGAPEDQGECVWWAIALVATFANCFETFLALFALAPISTGTNSDYGSFLITDYPSHIFRGALGYIPLDERIPKAKRKWATVRRIDENSKDNFCTIVFVDENKLMETSDVKNDQNPIGGGQVDEENTVKTVDELKSCSLKHTVPLGCKVALQKISYKNAPTIDVPIYSRPKSTTLEDYSGPTTTLAFLRAKAKHKLYPNYQKIGIMLNVELKESATSSFPPPTQEAADETINRDASMTEDGRLVL